MPEHIPEVVEKSRDEKGNWQVNYESDRQHITEKRKTEAEAREMFNNILKDPKRDNPNAYISPIKGK